MHVEKGVSESESALEEGKVVTINTPRCTFIGVGKDMQDWQNERPELICKSTILKLVGRLLHDQSVLHFKWGGELQELLHRSYHKTKGRCPT